MDPVRKLYRTLLSRYGPQGWWPLLWVKGTNPTKTGSIQGYHPGDYTYPRTPAQRFEICAGAILTQNTNWQNVEQALRNLKEAGALSARGIVALDQETLSGLIRPSGYFRQKAKKLRGFSAFYLDLGGRTPSREELLSLWGVGPETADAMLSYAYGGRVFVVDAYTFRIFSREGITKGGEGYEQIREMVEARGFAVEELQEFHALLVEEGKHMRTRK